MAGLRNKIKMKWMEGKLGDQSSGALLLLWIFRNFHLKKKKKQNGLKLKQGNNQLDLRKAGLDTRSQVNGIRDRSKVGKSLITC